MSNERTLTPQSESAIVDQLMRAPFATAAMRRKAAETIARLMVERDDAKADYVRVHRHYMNYRYGGSPPGTPPGRLADETPTHETKACAGCERGLPLDGYGHHYGRISNTGPLAPYYLDLTVCTAQNGTAGDCIACSVGNPGVYIKEGRMICPHRPDDSQVNGGVKT